MAIKTVEIQEVDQKTGKTTYAGYAKFNGDKYLGSYGGYGSAQRASNGSQGRGNRDMGEQPLNGGLRFQGNSGRGSLLGNRIRTAGTRQARRRSSAMRV